jgi:hypothetical protein
MYLVPDRSITGFFASLRMTGERVKSMIYQPPKDKPVYNLNNAYDVVKERLLKINIERQCRNSGAILQTNGRVLIKYLHDNYLIDPKSGDVSTEEGSLVPSFRDKILILHYFTRAAGTPLSNKQLTFRDLPGGLVYYPTFIKRTIQPLIETFGKSAPLLFTAGETLGAGKGEIGDASLIIRVFPRVPITLILWQGDEELTPDLNLLLDANILDYLESEDVTIVCEAITWRLINAVKKA